MVAGGVYRRLAFLPFRVGMATAGPVQPPFTLCLWPPRFLRLAIKPSGIFGASGCYRHLALPGNAAGAGIETRPHMSGDQA